MIASIIGIITLILLLMMSWRRRSKELRERFERPKFQFLKNLGIPLPEDNDKSPPDVSQENNHAKRNS
jgi:hypothetical protein